MADMPPAPWPELDQGGGLGGHHVVNGDAELSEPQRAALLAYRESSSLKFPPLLDDVRAFLGRFLSLPSDEALTAATLWVAHTHALASFECTPRLAFLSPEPNSGKTRALEILELLVPRPLLTVNVTPAYLFRRVADPDGPPTILYDEIDTVFGPKARDNEDIRGMLNAGYRRGATAGRCVIRGKTVAVEELPAFAAVALAGLDDLPDTIASRAVIVRMRRRAPHEPVQPYRRRVHESEGHKLRDRLAVWAGARRQALADAWPDLPDGIEDRDADIWEPLIAVADAAGGHWPDTARVAAVAAVADARRKAGGFGVKLLGDLRDVFTGHDRLSTEAVLEALLGLDESPWSDIHGKALDPRGLSRRLAKYEVKPKSLRLGERVVRGYERADLLDAWSRYLPEVASPPLPLAPLSPTKEVGEEGGRGRGGSEGPSEPPALRPDSATSATSATGDDPGLGARVPLSESLGHWDVPADPQPPPLRLLPELDDDAPDDGCADCGLPLPGHVLRAGGRYHPGCGAA